VDTDSTDIKDLVDVKVIQYFKTLQNMRDAVGPSDPEFDENDLLGWQYRRTYEQQQPIWQRELEEKQQELAGLVRASARITSDLALAELDKQMTELGDQIKVLQQKLVRQDTRLDEIRKDIQRSKDRVRDARKALKGDSTPRQKTDALAKVLGRVVLCWRYQQCGKQLRSILDSVTIEPLLGSPYELDSSRACCRHVWHLLTSERSRRAVALGERHADGLTDDDRLSAACIDARKAIGDRGSGAERAAAVVASMAASRIARVTSVPYYSPFALGQALDELARVTPPRLSEGEQSWCVHQLNDVLPPVVSSFSPRWRTADVLALAHQAYETRDRSLLPILGDALEEAGCDWGLMLAHCRDAEPHARGCWVLDTVLERE
jgi:hypothetical protein